MSSPDGDKTDRRSFPAFSIRRLAALIACAVAVVGTCTVVASAQESDGSGGPTGPSGPTGPLTLNDAAKQVTNFDHLNNRLSIVLGTLPADSVPPGTTFDVKLSGKVSTGFAVGEGPSGPHAGEQPFGSSTFTSSPGRPTVGYLQLNAAGKAGLRAGKKLITTMDVTATNGGDTGHSARSVSVYPPAPPHCFGAAARDAAKPCSNPKLKLAVVPTPDDALIAPNSYCSVIQRNHPLVCQFGSTKPDAEPVALVGDSHASHWRAGLEVVADNENWEGLSLAHASCPFSQATIALKIRQKECLVWNADVIKWFKAHPEVHTVFVSNHTGGKVLDPDHKGQYEEAISGYRKGWSKLPASVKHIIVITDVPHNKGDTMDCVSRAIRKQQPAGQQCAVSKSFALRNAETTVAAAKRIKSGRLSVIDMTDYFCGKKTCSPVIGGALVHKDADHLTEVYSRSLGPYLQRNFDRLKKSW